MKRLLLRAALFVAMAVLLVACARVLGIKPPEAKPFPHHEHLVKGINCRECHGGIAQSTDADPSHMPGPDTCVRCHEKPHDDHDCRDCHGQAYTREGADLARENLKFQHATHVARQKGECVHCHQGVETSSDHVRPAMAICLSCHEHQDDFAPDRTCDRCHKDLRGERVRPASHVVHDGDWLREHGGRASSARELCATCHSERFCATCHGVRTVPALPERMTFDDPLRAGMHRAGFASRHALEARTQPGLCQTCHTPDTCESCHADRHVSFGSGGASPHPPGWVGLRGEPNDHGRAAWRDPATCAACHQGAGEQLCIGCHRVGGVGGSPHRPGWTSRLRPTVDQPCRSCHGGMP
jgi:hypothetical protein